jgi:hypothetical protein
MKTEKYNEQIKKWPVAGKQVMGCVEKENIIVYQAFNKQIAEYAVTHQRFGGPAYSFNRMSWIKPGFLWMMYRAGWATKENQECILAITLPLVHFKTILRQAAHSSFDKSIYENEAQWKAALETTEVRLQWDPDYDPHGNKQQRKAIQIGMKGSILKQFCTEWLVEVEDITGFVSKEYEKVQNGNLNNLDIPEETVIELDNKDIEQRIGIVKTNS